MRALFKCFTNGRYIVTRAGDGWNNPIHITRFWVLAEWAAFRAGYDYVVGFSYEPRG